MRQGIVNSFRMIAALLAMGALAFAALATLSGCGGGTGRDGEPVGLIVRGVVQDEQGRGVSGIQITVLRNNVSAGTGTDGTFFINLDNATAPMTFRVNLGTRANEYYAIVGYRGRNVQGCAFDLPAPQGNRIEVGVVRVYSQGSPPPPPDEICND